MTRVAVLGLAGLVAAGSQPAPRTPEGSFKLAAICTLTATMPNGNNTQTCYYSCAGVGMQMIVVLPKACPLHVPAPRG